MKKKNRFKKWIGKIHLWLGLTSGLVVFIIAITGCIYAFQEEIQDLTQSYRFCEVQNKKELSPSLIQAIAEKELPGKHAHSVTYSKMGRSVEVSFYSRNPAYYYKAYLNPYSGEVLKVKNIEEDFFRIVLMGHFYLWLPPAIGQPVVATATLIFVLMIVSGLILWWPKNKNGTRQRFSIKWNSKWKRRNYDLHNILGFYVFIFGFVLALTGLVWGFQWFSKGLYWLTTGGKELIEYYEPFSDTTVIAEERQFSSVDLVWLKMKKDYPNAASIEVHYPENSSSVIAANANPEQGTYYKLDFRYFDQYTLEDKSVDHIYGRYQDADVGDVLRRMNYDIHVGAIGGLSGKILAFGASFIIASLPVTGFFIWWGRKKKKRKEKGLEKILTDNVKVVNC